MLQGAREEVRSSSVQLLCAPSLAAGHGRMNRWSTFLHTSAQHSPLTWSNWGADKWVEYSQEVSTTVLLPHMTLWEKHYPPLAYVHFCSYSNFTLKSWLCGPIEATLLIRTHLLQLLTSTVLAKHDWGHVNKYHINSCPPEYQKVWTQKQFV